MEEIQTPTTIVPNPAVYIFDMDASCRTTQNPLMTIRAKGYLQTYLPLGSMTVQTGLGGPVPTPSCVSGIGTQATLATLTSFDDPPPYPNRSP